jgi:hypothetical protein
LHVKQEIIVAPQEKPTFAMASILAKETPEKPYLIIVSFIRARLAAFIAELFNSVSSETGFNVLEITRESHKNNDKRRRISSATERTLSDLVATFPP